MVFLTNVRNTLIITVHMGFISKVSETVKSLNKQNAFIKMYNLCV